MQDARWSEVSAIKSVKMAASPVRNLLITVNTCV